MEDILKTLIEDYLEELRIAAQLKECAQEIQYDFLRKKVEKIVEEDLVHAKFLEEKIKENGGSLPPASGVLKENGLLRGKLSQDLVDKQILGSRYIEQSNQVVNEQEALGRALRQMAAAEKEHQSILLGILMKINP